MLGSIHFSFKEVPPNIYELREFLNDVSVQIAIAVDNILSYNSLKGAVENLEREKAYLLNNGDQADKYQQNQFCYVAVISRPSWTKWTLLRLPMRRC